MKKILLVLGFTASVGILSAFAEEVKVEPRVLKSFKQEFSTAADVNWVTGDNYYRAAFTYNGQHIFAYYSAEGSLLSVTRYLSPLQLPIMLLTELKNEYSEYWISDLFEVNKDQCTHYYITLENSDTKIILHSVNSGEWSIYSKKKKVQA